MKTETTDEEKALDPSPIMETGMAFMSSKVLISAIRMGLFTELEKGRMKPEEIRKAFGLHGRALLDYLDALVGMGFLNREGVGNEALYSNSEEASEFLVKGKPSYLGGIFEMANDRLFKYWNDLETALKTGEPQNEVKETGKSVFDAIYEDKERLRQFLSAMAGVQMGNFMTLAQKMDFSEFNVLCDVGGAGGELSMAISEQHPHLKCISYDLPKVTEVAQENIKDRGLESRVEARTGDFFEDDSFPSADVITMGNILHDWGTENKQMLLRKAYDSLNPRGMLIVIEQLIDNERKENVPGMTMSLNMLIETEEGYDFTVGEFDEWAKKNGFERTEIMPLTGPTSAGIAYKE